MKRRPTIMDVAARAGVSKSTVSLVLQRSDQVKPATRDAVKEAMAELGYVYNRAAAQLRSSSAGLIGLVINDLRNPFFTEFATVLQMSLADRGYSCVIGNSDETPALQARLIASMIEHGVTALVISPTYGAPDDAFDALARAELPVLQVLRQTDARTNLFPFSSFDYASGSAEAARHLIGQGARRIAFVGGQAGWAITEERMSGYLSEMAAAGLEPRVFHGPSSRAFGVEAAGGLLTQYPDTDGIICFNDLVALGMMSGLARLGRTVGPDLRLVGFDDIEECEQAWPQLSSVSCDISGFATETTARLLRWLDTGTRPEAETRMPVNLIARGSSLG